ncbi:MAG: NADH-quinone oxidoreductase subunit L [Actinomycetes bacterium]
MSALAVTAVVAVVAPALAAALGLPAGRRSKAAAVAFGVGGAAVALAAAVVQAALTWDGASATGIGLLGTALAGDPAAGGPAVDLVLRADELSGVVGLAVGVVALAVQVYSAAYLHGPGTPDAPTRYAAYAATVSLFTAAMMLVVHADDLVLLLVGWEVMGLASYLLVGHHSERPAARAAAVKAFLVTRVGDVGFLLGVVVLLVAAGTSSVTDLLALAGDGEVPTSTWTLATLLLLAGVVGKSAQFPLHTWLPDAMEGPTPVSALIHAATMVAAGVVVVAKLDAVFAAAPATLVVLALVAGVTMLGAALAALAQSDLKRLLAWSTVSQVAIMLAGLAVGTGEGRAAGLAHLMSHAAFKALLFLAAGCVAHLVGSNLLRDMGGVRRTAPVLAVSLGVGLAALAGLPPLAGFFSKEAVLSSVEDVALHGGGGLDQQVAALLMIAGYATTFVTGLYAARAAAVVLLGDGREPHRLPVAMLWPVVALAALTVVGGALLAPGGPSLLDDAHVGLVAALVGTALGAAGAAVGLLAAARPGRDVAAVLPARLAAVLHDGYRLDDAQHALVVRPVRALARVVVAGDADVVDAYVRGAAQASQGTGGLLRRLQTGVVAGQLGWVVAGSVAAGLVALAVAP